jgi:hypothetical protein
MRAVDIIIKKRDKQEANLTGDRFFRAGLYQWGYSRLSSLCLCHGGPAKWHDAL